MKNLWSNSFFHHSLFIIHFSLFIIHFFIIHFPYHPGRVSGGHAVVGDVLRNHASCSYDAPLAYCYAGAHHHSAAQPRVLAYRDGISRLHALAAQHMVHGVLRRVQLAVGAYQAVVADGNHAAVEHRHVVVYEHVAAYPDAVAVVAVEGRADHAVRRDARYEVFYRRAVAVVVYRHRVEPRAGFLGVLQTCVNLRVGEVVQLLAAHLFKFGHCFFSNKGVKE